MKRKIILVVSLLLTFGWMCYLASCNLLDPVRARVDQFLADLNQSDRSDMYLNFDPGINDWAGIQSDAFWNILPDAGIPYSISAVDTSDSSAVTFTLHDVGVLSWNVQFVMSKPDSDWLINKMYMDPTPIPAGTVIVE
jgi:hypothetical protein